MSRKTFELDRLNLARRTDMRIWLDRLRLDNGLVES